MSDSTKLTAITIESVVNAPAEKVWDYWTNPKHIMNWNNASPDWHTPFAENDPRTGGKFKSTMAARDGSMSFDFEGVYSLVTKYQRIEYSMADGRQVKITFTPQGSAIKITETFDPEQENPIEMQRGGWQAILDSFKKYTEEN